MIKNKILSIAPMLDRTDSSFRQFIRCFSKNAELYTEMISTKAILLGNEKKMLQYQPIEKPLILQLGGCDPNEILECTKKAEEYHYDGVNLNVGCPSKKALNSTFGIALMAKPDLISKIIDKVTTKSKMPFSIKTRIGYDQNDSNEFLIQFIDKITQAGCKKIILHARKALLNGISPKQNRSIPPINYDRVYKIKELFPNTLIEINGEVNQIENITKHLKKVDGIMIGRKAYKDPFYIHRLDQMIFGAKSEPMHIKNQLLHLLHSLKQQNVSSYHILSFFNSIFFNHLDAKQYRLKTEKILTQKTIIDSEIEDILTKILYV